MTIWHNNQNAYSLLVKQITKHFPSLIVVKRGDIVFVIGELFHRDAETGVEVFRYSIEIEFPHDYPSSVPLVRETGGKIPRTMNRHYDIQRNGACLFLDDQKNKFYSMKPDIVSFINNPVKNYFLSQSYYDLTEKWLFGDWSHGVFGIFEYYCEELKTKSLRVIINFLKFLSQELIDPYARCYCGANKTLRGCHIEKVNEMKKKIDINTARISYRRIVDLNQTILNNMNRNIAHYNIDKITGKPHII